jgi:RNA polymerase sigma-70 factor (ECF subfamily)
MENLTAMPTADCGVTESEPAAVEPGLWQKARDGDLEAADRLATATYRKVFAWLFKLTGNEELAADLTQETYRKAWHALGGFRGGCAITSWLCRIAYTTFLNHIRRPRSLVALSDEHENALRDPAESPEDSLLAAIAGEHLRRAVRALPEPLGFAVAARYWGELPTREIAVLQGVSPVTVRKRLRKALARLAVALEDEV